MPPNEPLLNLEKITISKLLTVVFILSMVLVPGSLAIEVGFSASDGGETVEVYDNYEVDNSVSINERATADFGQVHIGDGRTVSGSGSARMDQTYRGSGGYIGYNSLSTSGASRIGVESSACILPKMLGVVQSISFSDTDWAQLSLGAVRQIEQVRETGVLGSGSMSSRQSLEVKSGMASYQKTFAEGDMALFGSTAVDALGNRADTYAQVDHGTLATEQNAKERSSGVPDLAIANQLSSIAGSSMQAGSSAKTFDGQLAELNLGITGGILNTYQEARADTDARVSEHSLATDADGISYTTSVQNADGDRVSDHFNAKLSKGTFSSQQSAVSQADEAAISHYFEAGQVLEGDSGAEAVDSDGNKANTDSKTAQSKGIFINDINAEADGSAIISHDSQATKVTSGVATSYAEDDDSDKADTSATITSSEGDFLNFMDAKADGNSAALTHDSQASKILTGEAKSNAEDSDGNKAGASAAVASSGGNFVNIMDVEADGSAAISHDSQASKILTGEAKSNAEDSDGDKADTAVGVSASEGDFFNLMNTKADGNSAFIIHDSRAGRTTSGTAGSHAEDNDGHKVDTVVTATASDNSDFLNFITAEADGSASISHMLMASGDSIKANVDASRSATEMSSIHTQVDKNTVNDATLFGSKGPAGDRGLLTGLATDTGTQSDQYISARGKISSDVRAIEGGVQKDADLDYDSIGVDTHLMARTTASGPEADRWTTFYISPYVGSETLQSTVDEAMDHADDPDKIVATAGTYHEHDVLIDKNIKISGENPDNRGLVIFEADQLGRMFAVGTKKSDIKVGITGVTIQDGKAKTEANGDVYGGAIYNSADLALTKVDLLNSIARAEDKSGIGTGADGNGGYAYGGGIYSNGILSMVDSELKGNTAQGGDGTGDAGKGGYGGDGMGGGVYSDGKLLLTSSRVTDNLAQGGNGYGGDIKGRDGNPGASGSNSPDLGATSMTMAVVGVSSGADGSDAPLDNQQGASGESVVAGEGVGGKGIGGGIYSTGSELVIKEGSAITGNMAKGGDGTGGKGTGGDGGMGGSGGTGGKGEDASGKGGLVMLAVSAGVGVGDGGNGGRGASGMIGGAGGDGTGGMGRGGDAIGGGVYNYGSSITVTDSEVSRNIADGGKGVGGEGFGGIGGNGGAGGVGGKGGDGKGWGFAGSIDFLSFGVGIGVGVGVGGDGGQGGNGEMGGIGGHGQGGEGIGGDAKGAGIYSWTAPLTLTRSHVSENKAQGGEGIGGDGTGGKGGDGNQGGDAGNGGFGASTWGGFPTLGASIGLGTSSIGGGIGVGVSEGGKGGDGGEGAIGGMGIGGEGHGGKAIGGGIYDDGPNGQSSLVDSTLTDNRITGGKGTGGNGFGGNGGMGGNGGKGGSASTDAFGLGFALDMGTTVGAGVGVAYSNGGDGGNGGIGGAGGEGQGGKGFGGDALGGAIYGTGSVNSLNTNIARNTALGGDGIGGNGQGGLGGKGGRGNDGGSASSDGKGAGIGVTPTIEWDPDVEVVAWPPFVWPDWDTLLPKIGTASSSNGIGAGVGISSSGQGGDGNKGGIGGKGVGGDGQGGSGLGGGIYNEKGSLEFAGNIDDNWAEGGKGFGGSGFGGMGGDGGVGGKGGDSSAIAASASQLHVGIDYTLNVGVSDILEWAGLWDDDWPDFGSIDIPIGFGMDLGDGYGFGLGLSKAGNSGDAGDGGQGGDAIGGKGIGGDASGGAIYSHSGSLDLSNIESTGNTAMGGKGTGGDASGGVGGNGVQGGDGSNAHGRAEGQIPAYNYQEGGLTIDIHLNSPRNFGVGVGIGGDAGNGGSGGKGGLAIAGDGLGGEGAGGSIYSSKDDLGLSEGNIAGNEASGGVGQGGSAVGGKGGSGGVGGKGGNADSAGTFSSVSDSGGSNGFYYNIGLTSGGGISIGGKGGDGGAGGMGGDGFGGHGIGGNSLGGGVHSVDPLPEAAISNTNILGNIVQGGSGSGGKGSGGNGGMSAQGGDGGSGTGDVNTVITLSTGYGYDDLFGIGVDITNTINTGFGSKGGNGGKGGDAGSGTSGDGTGGDGLGGGIYSIGKMTLGDSTVKDNRALFGSGTGGLGGAAGSIQAGSLAGNGGGSGTPFFQSTGTLGAHAAGSDLFSLDLFNLGFSFGAGSGANGASGLAGQYLDGANHAGKNLGGGVYRVGTLIDSNSIIENNEPDETN